MLQMILNFFNRLFVQHNYRECKEGKVGHKRCLGSSRYILSE